MPKASTTNKRCPNPFGFMTRNGYRLALFSAWGLFVVVLLCGCGNGGNNGMDEKVLIRAGDSVVTVRTFHEAFESSITSPSLLFQDSAALRDIKYRILNRLSEELLILERARELNLEVSDEEAARVINDLKKDFPDDTFEKTLMENGVSFLTWEKALKRRLLMEKVIRHDLSERSFSTPLSLNENWEGDGSESPPENEAVNTADIDSESSSENEDVNADDSESAPPVDNEEAAEIPAHTMAPEAEYPNWINRLKQQYAIEIDWKLWEIIVQEQVNGV